MSLTGDTIFNLKKGENDFKQTIHHEVLLNDQNHVVTICSEERILDLRARGGNEADTVKSDGILVMDKRGKQIWNERMGSAYFMSDSAILISSSKKNTVVLTTLEGRYLWLLGTGFMPYRAEFIPAELLMPYIQAYR